MTPQQRLPVAVLTLRPGGYHFRSKGLIAIETVGYALAQLPAFDAAVIVCKIFPQGNERGLFDQSRQGVEDRPAKSLASIGILLRDLVEQASGQRPQPFPRLRIAQ